jgi:hypothetical protein
VPELASERDVLVQILAVAEEQLRWQRVAVVPHVRETIERTLTTTQLREAFELCDGETSSSDIANKVKTSKQSMSGWTRRWRDLGIAFETDGRFIQHLVSLRSLGIEITAPDRG